MIQTSEDYKKIMQRPIRNRGYAKVVLQLANQDAQSNATITSSGREYCTGSIFSGNSNSETYATMDNDFIPCDGSFRFASSASGVTYLDNGYTLGKNLTSMTISVSNSTSEPIEVTGLTIDFGEKYPTKFSINCDGVTTTYNNDNRIFVCDFHSDNLQTLTITPIEFVRGQGTLKIKSLIFGYFETFENEKLEDIKFEKFVSSIASETSYINCTVNVFDTEDKYSLEKGERYSLLESNQPIDLYFGLELDDESIEWHKNGHMWLKEWSSHNHKLKLVMTDKMSQQDEEYSLGHVLSSRTVYSELVRLFTDCGFSSSDYQIDDSLKTEYIVNPIPLVPRKDALQLICNASRCVYYENEDGVIVVRPHYENAINSKDVIVQHTMVTGNSKPRNVLKSGAICYADLSTNMIKADGSTLFYSTDFPSSEELKSGFVGEVSNDNGEYDHDVYLQLTYPISLERSGITINFGNPVPQQINIKTYNASGTVVENINITSGLESTFVYRHNFTSFKTIRISCVKTNPHSRFVINQIYFGDYNNYWIRKADMYDNPVGYKDQTIKKLNVPKYTYTVSGDDFEETKSDSTEVQLSKRGATVLCENVLLSTQDQTDDMADWLSMYYLSGISYDVDFRGDPTLQIGDVVHLENDYVEDIQTEIEKIEISFNGVWKGALALRKIITTNELDTIINRLSV